MDVVDVQITGCLSGIHDGMVGKLIGKIGGLQLVKVPDGVGSDPSLRDPALLGYCYTKKIGPLKVAVVESGG